MLSRFHERIALIEEDSRCRTYRELLELGECFSAPLRERSLLFLVTTNSTASIAGYIGFLRRGIVPVLLNNTISKELFDDLLAIYSPEYVFLPSSRAALAGPSVLLKEEEGYRLYEQREGIHSNLNPDLALVLTTSGSTGSPKLVRLSEKNLRSNAESIIEYLRIRPEDRAMTTMPMAYSYGLSIINSHLLAGASLIVTESSLTQRGFWDLLKSARPTTLGGVPHTYEMLKKMRFGRTHLTSLRYLTQAGGRLSPELVTEFVELCARNNARFIVMYGQTEATARMAYLPWEVAAQKPSSIGLPIPGGTLSLEDEEGRPIAETDVSGELIYKGPNVSLGYAESLDDLTKGDENNGVLHTGDIARRDADGFYYIVGRKKRFLKVFGNRLNLDDAERILRKAGFDVVCSGRDDLLRIYMTEHSNRESIVSFLSDRTGLHHSAFEVVFVRSIPRGDSGKVLYAQLEKEVV
ncbi:MAG: AMP-binding protein [Thermoguttaceae bacterium]